MKDYLDNGESHELKRKNMALACPPLSGFNHIAVFLRWAYANNMLTDQLFEKEPRLKTALDGDGDVREALATSDKLKGMLRPSYFKKEYVQFVFDTYYEKDIYPKKVDKYALEYFGEEKYNSAEFKNEGYLFVPYDDAYFSYMSDFLDGEWEKFSKTYAEDPDFLTIGNGDSLILGKYLGEKEEVIIPDEFIAIDEYAFQNCEGVKKVVIPASVKQIKGWAFANLNSLEQVEFSEGLEKIEREAFRGCKNLREVKLPESLNSLDYATFAECDNLEKLELGSKIKVFSHALIARCNKMQSLTIPESIEEMADINHLGGLKSLCVKSTLNKNKEVKITNCPELTEITFPDGFGPTKIHLMDCPKVEQVLIGSKAFKVVVKKNVGKLVDPDKSGLSAAGNIKALFGKMFAPSDKKEKNGAGIRVKFHYDKKLEMYVCEYKGIQFSVEDPDEDVSDAVGTLAENYNSRLNEIIEFMLPDLKELYGQITAEDVKVKLGKPTIDMTRSTVTYLEQSFDSDHIFEFEFMDDGLNELGNFSIDG